ncbi:MAG: hypothetical protein EOP18_03675 [Rhizobiaceae bacterium]|nr:MAG: hypothetical protein EOP18_03675 [Rhizobiaceae bacterium]
MSSGRAVYLTIEYVAGGGQRVRIPRGWVLLTLMLASWGAVSIVALALWGLFGLPFTPFLIAAAVAGALVYGFWLFAGRRLFIEWLEKLIDDDER